MDEHRAANLAKAENVLPQGRERLPLMFTVVATRVGGGRGLSSAP